MEENLPEKDRLDDFVQKSFDGYEEHPSLDMWQRISAGLDAAPTPVQPVAVSTAKTGLSTVWMWVASTALCLLMVSASMYLHYNTKIDHLENLVQQQKITNEQSISKEVETLVHQKVEEMMTQNAWEKRKEKTGEADPQDAQQKVVEQQKMVEQQKRILMYGSGHADTGKNATDKEQTMPDKLHESPTHGRQPTTPPRGIDQEKNREGIILNKNSSMTLPVVAGENQKKIETALYAETESEPTKDEPAAAPTHLWPLPKGNTSIPWTMHLPQMTFVSPAPVTKIYRRQPVWYAGIRIMPNNVRETSVKAPEKPIERPGSGPVPRQIPVFVSEKHNTSRSVEWGGIAGRKINRRWGIETGLSYISIEQEATHRPSFEFKNGRPHNSGGWHSRPNFDFDYNLNTYGGSASVSVRMEQIDRNNTVDPAEKVNLFITTRRTTQLLKMPLMVTYSLGRGRLQALVKLGPEGQYSLSNRLKIESVETDNSKLEVENAYKVQPVFDQEQRLRWGYRATAGLQYKLNKQWSIITEPVLSGTFSANTSEKQALPGMFLVGVNAGINYHF